MIKRALVVALIAATVGCSKSNSPTAASGIAPTTSIVISGLTSVAPAATMHLTLMAYHGSASPEDVTAQATWASSSPDVLLVTAGSVNGVREGEATITAQYGGLTATKALTVLTPGTYVVSGNVNDSGFGLANARVDVLSGVGAGKSAVTDANGAFKLYGIAGTVQMQASADSYQSAAQAVNVVVDILGFVTQVNFNLRPLITPDNVAGQWQLTIDASASCGGLPDAARHRTYSATIAQNNSALRIELSGATFAPDPGSPGGTENTFFGRINQSVVALRLDSYDYYGLHYDIGEVLTDGRFYTAIGTASGTATASTIGAALDGKISVSYPNGVTCTAADHRLTFVRTNSATRRR
jgi:hypothetical protein